MFPHNIPWEVIIVDNASTDNTSEVAREYWNDHNSLAHFQIVKEPEPGLSAARLKGFNTAQYEYMVLCDDDNWLAKDFVRSVYEIMNANDDVGIWEDKVKRNLKSSNQNGSMTGRAALQSESNGMNLLI